VKNPETKAEMHRRRFLKLTGTAGAGLALGVIWVGDGIAAIPAAQGYLLVNTRRCAACINCMLVCSLAHEGRIDLMAARIKVISDSFLHYPSDVSIEQCRQCVEPACVEACPTGALHIDAKNCNLRTVEAEKCVGCRSCIKACPFSPARIGWDQENKKALKCDLCADTPYWKEKGGRGGKKACIEVCPFNCISFTRKIPAQEGAKGYKVGKGF
jgi:protein NrfC